MNYLGWAGNLLIAIGLWKIGSKNRTGFVYQTVGEALWIAKSVWFGQYDLAFICCVFAALGVRSYFNWNES